MLRRIEALRAERSAARTNALDEALAPLLELAAYVLRKLHNAWSTR